MLRGPQQVGELERCVLLRPGSSQLCPYPDGEAAASTGVSWCWRSDDSVISSADSDGAKAAMAWRNCSTRLSSAISSGGAAATIGSSTLAPAAGPPGPPVSRFAGTPAVVASATTAAVAAAVAVAPAATIATAAAIGPATTIASAAAPATTAVASTASAVSTGGSSTGVTVIETVPVAFPPWPSLTM